MNTTDKAFDEVYDRFQKAVQKGISIKRMVIDYKVKKEVARLFWEAGKEQGRKEEQS